jgi:hypothetical protein
MFSPISNQSPMPESVGGSNASFSDLGSASPAKGPESIKRIENPRGIAFLLPPDATRMSPEDVHSRRLRNPAKVGVEKVAQVCANYFEGRVTPLAMSASLESIDDSEVIVIPTHPPTENDIGRSFLEGKF